MAFSDIFETPNTVDQDREQTPDTQRTGGEASFQDVIDTFTDSGDVGLISKLYYIERLQTRLEPKNLNSVREILFKLKSTQNYDEIDAYIGELQEISNRHEQAVSTAVSQAREDQDRVSSQVSPINKFREWLYGTNDYQEVASISVDGIVESIDEFNSRIEDLINGLRDTQEFKDLSPTEQQTVIENLRSISSGLDANKTIYLDFLNDKIDGLAEQIDSQEEGVIKLVLKEGQEVSFSSKESAYDFVKTLKSETESEMQGFARNILEGVGEGIIGIMDFGLDTLSQPYELLLDWSDDLYETWENDGSFAQYLWHGTFLLVGALASINYTETLWRRIVTDNLGKMGIERYKIGNFDRNRLSYHTGDTLSEDQSRYNARLDAYHSLKEMGATITGDKKVEFEKELDNILSYINIDTRTFWLKVHALRKGYGVTSRLRMSFMYGTSYTPFDVVRREIDYINSRYGETRVELEKGLAYVFNSPNFELNSNGAITGVNHSGESQRVVDIKNYVRGRTDISDSEKINIIRRIDSFLSELETEPRGEIHVKEQLLSLAKHGYLSIDEVKAKLESKYPFLLNEYDHNLSWRENLEKRKLELIEKYGMNFPESLLSGKAMAYRFYDMVNQGLWNGNLDDLTKVFSKIDSGETEIRQNYSRAFLLNYRFYGDFVKSIFGSYGLNSPSVSRMSEFFNGFTNRDLRSALEQGAEYTKRKNKLISIIDNGIESGNSRYNPATGLENYIRYELFNIDEERYMAVYNQFISDIKEGNTIYSELEFYRELDRIKRGFLPSNLVLTKLEEIRLRELSKPAGSQSQAILENVEKFIELAKDKGLDLNSELIDKISKGTLTFSDNAGYISIDFGEEQKQELFDELKSFEELDDYDYKSSLDSSSNLNQVEESLKKLYREEIMYSRIFAALGAEYPQNIDSELHTFARSLNQNDYTRGQVREVLIAIFRGQSYDLDAIVSSTKNHSEGFDMKQEMKNNLSAKFKSLDANGKLSLIQFIKDNKIDDSILPDNVSQALADHESGPERKARIDRQTSEFNRFKTRVSRIRTEERLDALEDEFNKYIRDQEIDRNSSEFKSLISGFESSLNLKREEIEARNNQSRVSQEVDGLSRYLEENTPSNQSEYEQARSDLSSRGIDIPAIPTSTTSANPYGETVRIYISEKIIELRSEGSGSAGGNERLSEDIDYRAEKQRIYSIFDRLAIELMLNGDDAGLDKLYDTFYSEANTREGIENFNKHADLEEFLKTEFGVSSIRARTTLQGILRRVIDFNSMPDLMNNSGKLMTNIRNLITTDYGATVREALASGKITR